MGTGTAAKACALMDYKFHGWEIDPQCFAAAEDSLALLVTNAKNCARYSASPRRTTRSATSGISTICCFQDREGDEPRCINLFSGTVHNRAGRAPPHTWAKKILRCPLS